MAHRGAREEPVTTQLLQEREGERQSFSSQAGSVPKPCPQHPRTLARSRSPLPSSSSGGSSSSYSGLPTPAPSPTQLSAGAWRRTSEPQSAPICQMGRRAWLPSQEPEVGTEGPWKLEQRGWDCVVLGGAPTAPLVVLWV